MSIDSKQLENIIIRPSLSAIGMMSEDAVQLLLATAAQESSMGTYLSQKNVPNFKGGVGIFQQEVMGYHRIWQTMIYPDPVLRGRVKAYLGYDTEPVFSRLVSDLALAAIICRLYYRQINAPLPSGKDVPAMAAYWKKYYNTALGKGTEQEFINNYVRYVQKGTL